MATQCWPNPLYALYSSVTTEVKHLLHIFAYMEDRQTQSVAFYRVFFNPHQSSTQFHRWFITAIFYFWKKSRIFKETTIPGTYSTCNLCDQSIHIISEISLYTVQQNILYVLTLIISLCDFYLLMFICIYWLSRFC